ncbi:MAG TPA: GatB/YqeY domain-containing protein [Chloroflexota bacterium]|nr:GatB/YqeY domain-containing protein [Chloroflexota bacterium]
MPLTEQIDDDLVQALKRQDKTTLAALRLLKAAVKNREIAKRDRLTDDEYLEAIRREIKMRRESSVEYERAGRDESVAEERAAIAILERYLPAQLDDQAIRTVLEEIIADTGASGPGDVGKVMSRAMPALRGRADGSQVNQIARDLLQARS